MFIRYVKMDGLNWFKMDMKPFDLVIIRPVYLKDQFCYRSRFKYI